MLDRDAVFTTDAAMPPFRDRLATIPHDLSEYARAHTGPSSWSAACDADGDALPAWAREADNELCVVTNGMLLDLSPTDVPHVAMSAEQVARLVAHREAFVVASIDGESTLEEMLDTVDLPAGEVLAIICRLSALGVVVLAPSE